MLSNWQRPESVTAALVRAWGNRPVYIYMLLMGVKPSYPLWRVIW